MGSQWSEEKAISWSEKQPYYWGANFYPSDAINQLEMWQEDSFNPDLIYHELSHAESIGMNLMRVYLHDLIWEQDSEGFINRIEEYLSIAEKHSIKTMFVFFDDCWNSEFSLGKQPNPKPYTHNSGWVQSPGNKIVNDPSQWARLENYVKGILDYFKNDERIAYWDLYNEPGNGSTGDDTAEKEKQGDNSLSFLKKVFEWAWDIRPDQPLTCAYWHDQDWLKGVSSFCLDHSDIISFHSYQHVTGLNERMEFCKRGKRPMVCSEYLARGVGSNYEQCLRFLKSQNIAAINWGLVSGKTQTIYPWGWNEEKGEPIFYFHDVFNTDGSLLYPHEKIVFDEIIS
jgi:hypothetical protein